LLCSSEENKEMFLKYVKHFDTSNNIYFDKYKSHPAPNLRPGKDRINWEYLSKYSANISYLEENENKIDWILLSYNKNAVRLQLKRPKKLNWKIVSEYTNSWDLLENNKELIKWDYIIKNKNKDVIQFVKENISLVKDPYFDKIYDEEVLSMILKMRCNINYYETNNKYGNSNIYYNKNKNVIKHLIENAINRMTSYEIICGVLPILLYNDSASTILMDYKKWINTSFDEFKKDERYNSNHHTIKINEFIRLLNDDAFVNYVKEMNDNYSIYSLMYKYDNNINYGWWMCHQLNIITYNYEEIREYYGDLNKEIIERYFRPANLEYLIENGEIELD
jgi:hypothetical protein